MLRFLSLSAPLDYTKFDWYKFSGTRPVKLETSKYTVQIDAGERIGIKFLDKNSFQVVHEDAPTVAFPCDAKTARSLLTRSTPYKGKVKNKAVNNSKLGGPTVERDPQGTPPTTDIKPKITADAQSLLRAIRHYFLKPRSISYAGTVEELMGHRYFFYDATASLDANPVKGNKWVKESEALLLKAFEGTDCEVGAEIKQGTARQKSVAYLIVKVT